MSAVVAGIWSAGQKIRKSILAEADTASPNKVHVLGASIMENITLRDLTEANRELTEQQRQVCTRLSELIEIERESARIRRSATEEYHRLRVAVVDLHEFLKVARR